jgi:hypothetical protein
LLPILALYVALTLLLHSAVADEPVYIGYASNLTHGYYAQAHSASPSAYLWHGPALPLLLAPLVAFHLPLEVMRVLVGPVLLFGAIAVFHRVVRLDLRERQALGVTYALALYLPFFTVLGPIHVEPLATLCFTLVVFFMVRSIRGGSRDHVWAALALAVLALSRVEFGYVLVASLALSLLWLVLSHGSRPARRSFIAVVLALLFCTPWLAYTYSVASRPFYWGNSGGLSLYWMTAPGNLGDWQGEPDAFAAPQLVGSRSVFDEIKRLKPLDQDAKLQSVALQNIKTDPNHYLTNVVNNIGRLVFNTPYSFTNEKASTLLYMVPNALLLGLLAIATFVVIKVRQRPPAEIVVIAVFAILGFCVHIPVAAYARFVIPLVPAAVWLAVAIVSAHVRVVSDPAHTLLAPSRTIDTSPSTSLFSRLS